MTISGNPPLFSVISPGLDRVTMIDSVTGKRATFRVSGQAREIVPIDGGSQVGLWMKGAEIRRVGLYDRRTGRWIEHDLDLGEPATEVMPLMGPSPMMGPSGLVGFTVKAPETRGLLVFDGSEGAWVEQALREPAKGAVGPLMTGSIAQYQIGRFLYLYSQPAKKWSVLELKRGAPAPGVLGGNSRLADGRIMVPDGDLIHIYDPRTGEWAHIDTKDEP